MSYTKYGLPEDFDPKVELLNITTIHGEAQVTVYDIDDYFSTLMKSAIIFGVRVGATTIAMLALFLASKARKTPFFIINQICLSIVLLHSALYLGCIFGGYASLAYQISGFPELLTANDVNLYIATNFFNVLLVSFIEVSLVFQVRTMFQNPSSRKEYASAVTILTTSIGLVTVGLSLYNFIKATLIIKNDSTAEYSSGALNAQPILFASSINFMSLLLIGKLIMAIKSRRYLGLKQFDGFHILLIMTSQSMILPSVILIISYAVDEWQKVALPSLSTFLVALSLPLSSMWASSANNSSNPTSTGYLSQSPAFASNSPSFYSSEQTYRGDANSSKLNESGYSPSSVDGDSRRFWYQGGSGEDNGDAESEFISKTTHQITSRRS